MSSLTLFEKNENAPLPAHVVALAGGGNNDLLSGMMSGGFPVISYKGKVWHVVDGDTRTMVTNADGDPAASLEVVILKANPNLSKVYYASGYEEGSNAKPTCYSNDGKGPAADATEPQSSACATCPHNAWGSRVSENGSKGKACSDSRRLAVAPVGELDYPMLLRVPAGTLKELVEYAKMLDRRKVGYQAVVTKVAFDHTVAHQKFTFKAVRFVTPEEAQSIRDQLEGETVQQILGFAAAAVVPQDDGLGETPEHVKQPAPKAVAAPKAAPKLRPVPKSDPMVIPEEVEEAIASVAKPKPKAAPAPAPANKKVDHSSLLAEANASLDDVLSALDD